MMAQHRQRRRSRPLRLAKSQPLLLLVVLSDRICSTVGLTIPSWTSSAAHVLGRLASPPPLRVAPLEDLANVRITGPGGSGAKPLAYAAVPSVDAQLPETDSDGIYNITDAQQHKALLAANPDKIVVLKVYAPFCKACKSLAPKYVRLAHDEKYSGLPIIWAQMSIEGKKDYIKSLGIVRAPSVLLYAGAEELPVENFPCGPRKLPILKKKLSNLIDSRVDPATLELKAIESRISSAEDDMAAEMMGGDVVSDTLSAPQVASYLSGLSAMNTSLVSSSSITTYLDTLASGAGVQMSESGAPNYLGSLTTSASPQMSGKGMSTYLDSINEAQPSTTAWAGTPTYLDSFVSKGGPVLVAGPPVASGPSTGSAVSGYLDALSTGGVAVSSTSQALAVISYLDTLNTSPVAR